MELKNILVPTDFSQNAESALRYAMELAQRAEAVVHILHVPVLPIPPLVDAANAVAPQAIRDIYARAQQAVDALASEHARRGVQCLTVVREGVVHKTINQHMTDNDVDLLVMGTHGRTGITKVLLGSVTARVLGTTAKPLIVVPEAAAPPTSILVAYDFSEPAKRAAQLARCIHGLFPGALHLAHAYVDTLGGYAELGAVTSEAAERRHQALELGFKEMLEASSADLFSIDSLLVQTRLAMGEPAPAILKIAEEVDAKLICAGSTGKGGIERWLVGSVARALVQASPVPVLLAPTEA